MIKKILSNFYYKKIFHNPLGFRLRNLFSKKEILTEIRPWQSNSVVSDLFLWRVDKIWDTEFKLFNISSFIFPDEEIQEDCEILIFNSYGELIEEKLITLKPMEMKNIKISNFISFGAYGSFSIFHYSNKLNEFALKNSHVTERGYVGYLNKKDDIRSYCHGNLQSLSKIKGGKFKSIVNVKKSENYYPQLILSDCTDIDLFYSNPSFRSLRIEIDFLDKENNLIYKLDDNIKSLGCKKFKIKNTKYKIHTFRNNGKILMWRPIIFKNYKTHFDVMHG